MVFPLSYPTTIAAVGIMTGTGAIDFLAAIAHPIAANPETTPKLP